MNNLTRLVLLAAVAAILGIGTASAAVPAGSGAAASNAPSFRAGPPGPGVAWRRHGAWRAGPRWRSRSGPMLVQRLIQDVRDLDLTAAQRSEIRQLIDAARPRSPASARPLFDLTVLGNPESPEYAAAIARAKEQAVDRISRASALWGKIYAVLTPAQRRNLATLLAADQLRMEHRREEMRRMRERMRERG